jgi:small subunit ribosomal protein S14
MANSDVSRLLNLHLDSSTASQSGCGLALFGYFSRSFMAKTSWINRNERKRATVKKYAALRAELKGKKDYAGLAQLPRDASPTRVVNRCQISGRRRAFIRRFKISRLTFRELASSGLIPGVTKSSW